MLPDKEIAYLSAAVHSCDPSSAFKILEAFPNFSYPHSDELVTLLDDMSSNTSQLFSYCSFQGIKIDCDKIFKKIITDSGFCFTFNMQEYQKIFNANISSDFDCYKGEKLVSDNGELTHASKVNTLIFVLNLDNKDIPNTCVYSGKGFKIGFHQPNEMPNPFIDEYFVPYFNKREMLLKAKVTKYDKLAFTYKPNQRGVYAPNERQLKYFRLYAKSQCDYEALIDFVLRVCGCVKFSMPRFKGTPVCDLTKTDCYVNATKGWPYSDENHKTDSPMP